MLTNCQFNKICIGSTNFPKLSIFGLETHFPFLSPWDGSCVIQWVNFSVWEINTYSRTTMSPRSWVLSSCDTGELELHSCSRWDRWRKMRSEDVLQVCLKALHVEVRTSYPLWIRTYLIFSSCSTLWTKLALASSCFFCQIARASWCLALTSSFYATIFNSIYSTSEDLPFCKLLATCCDTLGLNCCIHFTLHALVVENLWVNFYFCGARPDTSSPPLRVSLMSSAPFNPPAHALRAMLVCHPYYLLIS